MNKVFGLKLLRRKLIVRRLAMVLLLAESSLLVSGCIAGIARPG